MGSLTQAPWPSLARGSQVLVVQTMPSSQVGAGTTVSQAPPTAEGSRRWVQVPPLHVSVPLQKRPSLQEAALLGWVQAPAPLHTSSVQTLPSSGHGTLAGVWQLLAASLHMSLHWAPPVHGSPLCVQVPPLQVSVPSQKRPSSQDAVFGVCAQVPAP